MTVFFTADHHFGHHGVLSMSKRPFANVDEMDRVMIKSWNAVVRPSDIVWHLGDFSFKSPKPPSGFFDLLHGTKHLVVGNHDRAGVREAGWASVQESAQIAVDGERMYLHHFPHLEWPAYFRGSIHLFGHVHGNRPGVGRSCDVGVDVWAFRPVALPDILVRIGDVQNV